MNLITCQHEWVEYRQSCYRCEPPAGFHFENAHYPLSEKLGGKETTRLWYPDHIIQGCLQTLEHKYPCIDVRKSKTERKIVETIYPEYLSIYDEAYVFCQRFAAPRGGKKAKELGLGIHRPEVRTYTGRVNAEAKSKPVILVNPNGDRILFKSSREAERQTNLHQSVICGSANKNGWVLRKGRGKGWYAIWANAEDK